MLLTISRVRPARLVLVLVPGRVVLRLMLVSILVVRLNVAPISVVRAASLVHVPGVLAAVAVDALDVVRDAGYAAANCVVVDLALVAVRIVVGLVVDGLGMVHLVPVAVRRVAGYVRFLVECESKYN